MPLSYAAVIGGVITVIGTSTNLVVSDLLVESGEESLDIFEITPVGLPIAIVAVLVLTLTSHRLARKSWHERVRAARCQRTRTHWRCGSSPTARSSVKRCTMPVCARSTACSSRGSNAAVGSSRFGPETLIGADDVCYFAGDVDDVVDVLETPGLVSAEQSHLGDASARVDAGLYEVVVAERSELAGSTLSEVGFRAHYDAAVLAIKRHDDDMPGQTRHGQAATGGRAARAGHTRSSKHCGGATATSA